MKKIYKNEANYYYDPQLKNPYFDFYPHSAFDFHQERWVPPLCLLVKDSYLNSNSFFHPWNGMWM